MGYVMHVKYSRVFQVFSIEPNSNTGSQGGIGNCCHC